MSKIIYSKVRTAPGLKLTDANWEASAAYFAKAVSIETLSLAGFFPFRHNKFHVVEHFFQNWYKTVIEFLYLSGRKQNYKIMALLS